MILPLSAEKRKKRILLEFSSEKNIYTGACDECCVDMLLCTSVHMYVSACINACEYTVCVYM